MSFLRNFLLLGCIAGVTVTCASAQSDLDVFFGVGTATAPSSNSLIDTFQDGNLFSTPKMAGTFGKVGGDILITPHFGINAETDFRFKQGAYAGLNYRPIFYDFNGVWLPFGDRLKRVVPELEGGLGGASIKFYYSSSYCDAFAGCSTSNQYIESSNHFQLHMAAGVRFYVTHHIFIRPQIDAHWVNNFYQFGSNWVPEYGASVGWSFVSH
ncbi:MAG TPA: hypothetical protein VKX25_15070 [Bryobacteraceae bacterium]|jgi:hypothetical protein|nr:hypothetical protein [Bryobacteraceae bacterium]